MDDSGGTSPGVLVACAAPGGEAEGKGQRFCDSRLCVTPWRGNSVLQKPQSHVQLVRETLLKVAKSEMLDLPMWVLC